MVVKAHVKDAKAVVKMAAKRHAAVDVGKVAKDVVAQCAKVIALRDAKLRAILFVEVHV